MIELVSPVGHPRVQAQAPRLALGNPILQRVGFIWNQYQTPRNFWPRREREVEALCKPSAFQRAYKSNTWMPLERAGFGARSTQVDYLVIGVGA